MNLFENNVTQIYGDRGKSWLSTLPKQVDSLAKHYTLCHLTPITYLSYHYVLSGFQGNQPIILKLGLDIPGLKREAAALRALAGYGAVTVLAEADGVLLLEQVVPGTSLKSYFPERDHEAINIACQVIKRLHSAPRCATAAFPHVKNWLAALNNDWDIPAHYLHTARQICGKLLATAAEPVLLHGDLHHDNILKSGDHWMIIDPKGVVGKPAFEVAAFIRNPIPELLSEQDASVIIEKRITTFANLLDLPKIRILHYCFVEAILSWVWMFEDHDDADYFEKLTPIFYRGLIE